MPTERPENYQEFNVEKEKILDITIVSLNHCESINQMIHLVEQVSIEGQLDTVILGEYNFTVDEVLGELEKIQNLARSKNIDIILAPDNNESGGKLTWGELKQQFQDHGVNIEQTSLAEDYRPETVGVYVGKNGFTYAFPKTWHREEVHNPVHRIPNTTIGVTICGEIGHIQPQDLEGVKILYNPSREGDDPSLKYRMMVQYGNATKEDIAKALAQEEEYDYLLESDEDYQRRMEDSHARFYRQVKEMFNEKTAQEMLESIKEHESKEDNSIEARRKEFDQIVEKVYEEAVSSQGSDSIYVRDISPALKQANIPVVRCDDQRTTGILNPLPNMKVEDLEYKNAYTKYRLKMKK